MASTAETDVSRLNCGSVGTPEECDKYNALVRSVKAYTRNRNDDHRHTVEQSARDVFNYDVARLARLLVEGKCWRCISGLFELAGLNQSASLARQFYTPLLDMVVEIVFAPVPPPTDDGDDDARAATAKQRVGQLCAALSLQAAKSMMDRASDRHRGMICGYVARGTASASKHLPLLCRAMADGAAARLHDIEYGPHFTALNEIFVWLLDTTTFQTTDRRTIHTHATLKEFYADTDRGHRRRELCNFGYMRSGLQNTNKNLRGAVDALGGRLWQDETQRRGVLQCITSIGVFASTYLAQHAVPSSDKLLVYYWSIAHHRHELRNVTDRNYIGPGCLLYLILACRLGRKLIEVRRCRTDRYRYPAPWEIEASDGVCRRREHPLSTSAVWFETDIPGIYDEPSRENTDRPSSFPEGEEVPMPSGPEPPPETNWTPDNPEERPSSVHTDGSTETVERWDGPCASDTYCSAGLGEYDDHDENDTSDGWYASMTKLTRSMIQGFCNVFGRRNRGRPGSGDSASTAGRHRMDTDEAEPSDGAEAATPPAAAAATDDVIVADVLQQSLALESRVGMLDRLFVRLYCDVFSTKQSSNTFTDELRKVLLDADSTGVLRAVFRWFHHRIGDGTALVGKREPGLTNNPVECGGAGGGGFPGDAKRRRPPADASTVPPTLNDEEMLSRIRIWYPTYDQEFVKWAWYHEARRWEILFQCRRYTQRTAGVEAAARIKIIDRYARELYGRMRSLPPGEAVVDTLDPDPTRIEKEKLCHAWSNFFEFYRTSLFRTEGEGEGEGEGGDGDVRDRTEGWAGRLWGFLTQYFRSKSASCAVSGGDEEDDVDDDEATTEEEETNRKVMPAIRRSIVEALLTASGPRVPRDLTEAIVDWLSMATMQTFYESQSALSVQQLREGTRTIVIRDTDLPDEPIVGFGYHGPILERQLRRRVLALMHRDHDAGHDQSVLRSVESAVTIGLLYLLQTAVSRTHPAPEPVLSSYSLTKHFQGINRDHNHAHFHIRMFSILEENIRDLGLWMRLPVPLRPLVEDQDEGVVTTIDNLLNANGGCEAVWSLKEPDYEPAKSLYRRIKIAPNNTAIAQIVRHWLAEHRYDMHTYVNDSLRRKRMRLAHIEDNNVYDRR